MRRPLIAVTSAELLDSPFGRGLQRFAVPLTYLHAVERAGGLPVCLPPVDGAAEQLAGTVDGLLLCGGPDVHHRTYAGVQHPQMIDPADPAADIFEAQMIDACARRDLPILAVCRGMQLLNVIRGGSLHQHLADRPGTLAHSTAAGADSRDHRVTVAAGSLLAAVCASRELTVNTYHHQAVDRLGEGLRAAAHAPDGIVEAVEDPSRRFLLGVQWHPEAITHAPAHAQIIEAFVDAARRRATVELPLAA